MVAGAANRGMVDDVCGDGDDNECSTDIVSPFYTNLVHLTLKFKYAVVLLIVAATIPVIPYAIPVRSDVFTDIVPRGSTSYNGFKSLTSDFGAGVALPFSLLISVNENIIN